jgi:hypothetical protein
LNQIKNGRAICPPEEISIAMALYALGFVSRYRPELWNPFVRKDQSGERLLIERFLSVAKRKLPNLLLDRLSGTRTVFTNVQDGGIDLTEDTDREDTIALIRDEIRVALEHDRLRRSK